MTERDLVIEFGYDLRDALKEYGITQKTLAKEAHIHPSVINRYLHGEQLPSFRNLINIAYVLECELSDLVDISDLID